MEAGSQRRVVSLVQAEHADDELIARASDGDRAAFGELYARYGRAVRDLCRRLVNDPSRVEDLAQETFARALTHIERFRSGDRLWPWLSTIARNVCIDELRMRSGSKIMSLDDEGLGEDVRGPLDPDTPAELVVRGEDRARMRRALSRAFAHLAPHDRRILWLHSVEEWEYQDIAKIDGSTVHTVRNIAFRARRRIREYLEESNGVPVVAPALLPLRRWLGQARAHVSNAFARLAGSGGDLLVERGAVLLAGVTVVIGMSVVDSSVAKSPEYVLAAPAPSHGSDRRIASSASGRRPHSVSARRTGAPSVLPRDDLPLTFQTTVDRDRDGTILKEAHNERWSVRDPDGNELAGGNIGWACTPHENPLFPEGGILGYTSSC